MLSFSQKHNKNPIFPFETFNFSNLSKCYFQPWLDLAPPPPRTRDPDSKVPISDILDQMLTCRRGLNTTVKHLILGQNLTIWMMSNKILQHEKRLEKTLDFSMSRLLEELAILLTQSRDGSKTKW